MQVSILGQDESSKRETKNMESLQMSQIFENTKIDASRLKLQLGIARNYLMRLEGQINKQRRKIRLLEIELQQAIENKYQEARS